MLQCNKEVSSFDFCGHWSILKEKGKKMPTPSTIKTIALDLDNTVFDLEPVYKLGFKDYPQYRYHYPTSWAVYECYPKPVADKILGYFKTIENYKTPLISKRYPLLIHNWQQKYDIKVITSRKTDSPDVWFFGEPVRRKESLARVLTYEQIWDAGMFVRIDNIIVVDGNSKMDAFKKEKIDLVIDDSPIVIEECIAEGIDHVMISTRKTPYNHYLRDKAIWARNLFEVAKIKGL